MSNLNSILYQLRFFIKKLKIDIHLVFVYGPAQEEGREQFLLELAQICSENSLPMIIGGDFNIMRFSSDKNKKFCNNKWSDMFNQIINTYELRDIHLSGGKYTWSNNQSIPTLEKLDRVLMNKAWETHFPMTNIRKKPRIMSDHNPLTLSVDQKVEHKRKPFRFEISWLHQEGFKGKLKEIWDQPMIAKFNVEKWMIKEKRIKKYFKGWSNKRKGNEKKRKMELQDELLSLETIEEDQLLTAKQLERKTMIQSKHMEICEQEELYWNCLLNVKYKFLPKS